MKKLIMAAAIVCAAVAAQASTANWRWTSQGTTTLYSYGSSTTALGAGTIYIFLDGNQEAVFNQWKTDGTMLTALDSKTVTSGKIAAASTEAKEFSTSYTTETKQSFFTALIDSDGNLFIGNTKSNNSISETALGTSISVSLSKSTVKFADSESYQGQGWYTAVPEPTSGLLLLLGMAGLALRRRRA